MSLMLKIGVAVNEVQTGLARVEGMVTRFGGRLTGALAGAIGVGAFGAVIKQSIEMAGRLEDLSERFNAPIRGLQLLGNVAKEKGADIESIGQAFKFLGKNAQLAAQQGTGDLVDAFAAIGVTGKDLSTLRPDEIFLKLSDAFKAGRLTGQEFAVTAKLLGRGFEQLIPVIRLGSDEIRRIGEAKGISSEAAVRQLARVEDFLTKINNLTKVAAGEVTFGFIKSFQEFLKQGPAGSVAAALEKALFGEQKAPAGRRSGGSRITELNAGRSEEQIREAEKQAKREADFELDLIEARISGRRKAEQILEEFEDQTAKEQIRKAEERGRELTAAMMSVEELVAERQGPQAELDLQRRRAAEAAQLAREQGTAENVLAANQEANRLQRMLESDLRDRGFGDASFRRAQFQAQQITGMVPGVEALRDMTLSRQMQDPVQNTTVQKIANTVSNDVLARLDTLIRKAGNFSE